MSRVVAFSEAAAIGLHSMVVIVRNNRVLNAAEIADLISSSKHHVSKVMQRLAKSGFVASTRGPSGGFYLKIAPDELSLLNIYEAIEGKIEDGSCPARKEKCPFNECILGDASQNITFEVKEYLSSKTLSDYID
ncbi:Rrf2 family transcriptional regulator [Marinilabiliaceae bacterium ANBcel2]|nr:Rrf2 family transcriptional regulator [Marinilabiliaceae bacterium ANBcel2]